MPSPELPPTGATDYVVAGGNLLLLGEKCAHLFEPILGAKFEGAPAQRTAELVSASGVTNADGVWQKVALTTARPAASLHPTRDTRKDGEVAATVNAFGKGKVAAVYGPVASVYFRSHHPWLRDLIGTLAADLFPEPAVKVEGPPGLDVSLRTTRDGRLSVHLLNTTGMPLPDRYGFTESTIASMSSVVGAVSSVSCVIFWSAIQRPASHRIRVRISCLQTRRLALAVW